MQSHVEPPHLADGLGISLASTNVIGTVVLVSTLGWDSVLGASTIATITARQGHNRAKKGFFKKKILTFIILKSLPTFSAPPAPRPSWTRPSLA